ncbi:MAG: choice-of-anchor E domain-containing protein, partial [Chloroflexota bacterium]
MKYLDPLLLTVPDRVRQFCNPTNPIQITQALDKRIQAKPKLRLLAPLLAFFFLLCGSNLAYADEIIYSDEIGTRRTNWNDSLQIPQFDPNLGILSSIEIRLSANVVGSAAFENTGPSSAPVTMTHSALVTIILPTGTSVTSVPTNRLVTTVPRFDNEFDYAGESGDTVQLSATDVDEVVLTEAAEMAPFIGTGIINFPAEALGSSSSQGPGNFALLLSANSSGVVLTIHYIFAVTDIDIETYTNGFDADDANDPTVPEIAVGDPVTWTYDVQNTGEVTFTLDEVVVTDSVTGVVPEFIPSSDDGDGLLAPGEVWQYRFVTTAIDLTDAPDGTPIVDGCDAGNTFRTRPTYENVGTVTVDRYSLIDTDPTHHCTPFDQSLTVRKLINGIDVQANRSNNVPQLEPGDPITWTYEVLNDGNATFALNELSVTDSDPAVTPVFDPTSDSGGDQLLSPGETWLYTATGTAQNLDRPNPGTSIVSGCGPEESDAQRSAYQNVATVVAGDIVQVDESFYCQDRSTELTIEKLTNGFDADLPNDSDVPQLTPGDSVTWTYQVQNIGSGQVTLSDIQVTDSQTGIIPRFDPESDVGSDGILSPDETWLFMATSLVQYLHLPDPTVDTVPGCDPDGEGRLRNAYVNIGTVTLGSQSDTDSSHYCIAPNPQIQVEKLTNGIDADDPNEVGVPLVAPGAEVIWTYLVKNVGNVPLPQADIRVTDSQTDILPVLDDSSDSNADQILSPGETWRYQASATAVDLTVPPANIQTISGCDPANLNLTRLAYMNTATVTVGTINDTDSSHYCNPPLSDLVIEKRTNTVDADQPNDRFIPIVAPGEPITWTYTVRNRGAITYTAGQVSVTDSDPAVEPTWMPDSDRNDDQLLSPGEIWRYIAIGVAQDLTAPDPGTIVVDGCDPDNTGAKRATYQNIAIVQAGSSSDSDASHYCQPPVRSLDILKLTNGIDVADANAPSVPRLAPGDPIQWTYLITNTGLVEIPLDEITVTDSDLNVTPLFDATSDVNNDAILSPGESWRYHASGQALELSSPNPGTTVVQGCSSNGTVEPRPTYQNAATVEAGETADSDVSYYCNVIP